MQNHKKLMQLLVSNQNKDATSYRVETNVDAEIATIFIYGVIDESFGISAQSIAANLLELRDKAVILRINSPGGDVFDARAIYAAIKTHGNVIAQIDGLAASAATYVAAAAKSVKIVEGGFVMIHNAWTFGFGDKNDFTDLASLLSKFDVSIVDDYIKKTGKSRQELVDMMNAETWFNADEALQHGFVDEIFDESNTDSSLITSANNWDLSAFDNAPAALARNEQAQQDEAWKRQRAMSERRLRLLNALTH